MRKPYGKRTYGDKMLIQAKFRTAVPNLTSKTCDGGKITTLLSVTEI